MDHGADDCPVQCPPEGDLVRPTVLDCGKTKLCMHLIEGVSNAGSLKDAAVKKEFSAALIRPKLIMDRWQVTVASYIAWQHQCWQKMTTRTLASEIMFLLSFGKNIKEAFQNFGIDAQDTAILVVTMGDDASEQMDHVLRMTSGSRPVALDLLATRCDREGVKKLYKIQEDEVGALLDNVVNRIASKDILLKHEH